MDNTYKLQPEPKRGAQDQKLIALELSGIVSLCKRLSLDSVPHATAAKPISTLSKIES
ncbi:hypothetical protein FIBSPDRAFT_854279 [Athelia psychrophila]|uniref:Uncharacterized protein n=1 Tax=Athelia psychrophila TaxID=1759441 RepID=A0A166QAJ0_9AGAM|nr:hypothetical protein FIBSPDRAFT_854279 [Fibularhizoctonia sp. CBS 109695]